MAGLGEGPPEPHGMRGRLADCACRRRIGLPCTARRERCAQIASFTQAGLPCKHLHACSAGRQTKHASMHGGVQLQRTLFVCEAQLGEGLEAVAAPPPAVLLDQVQHPAGAWHHISKMIHHCIDPPMCWLTTKTPDSMMPGQQARRGSGAGGSRSAATRRHPHTHPSITTPTRPRLTAPRSVAGRSRWRPRFPPPSC
jgi:hypothetical protein